MRLRWIVVREHLREIWTGVLMIASGLFLFGCFQIKPASAIPYWLGVGGFLLGLVLVLVQSSGRSVFGQGGNTSIVPGGGQEVDGTSGGGFGCD